MKKTAGGLWEKMIYVFPGRYEYKFWVDGHWRTDPNNNKTRTNCYGTQNSIIIVEPKPQEKLYRRIALDLERGIGIPRGGYYHEFQMPLHSSKRKGFG